MSEILNHWNGLAFSYINSLFLKNIMYSNTVIDNKEKVY